MLEKFELSKRIERYKYSECQLKLVATESGIAHDDYLQQLFRGGTPSIALHQKQPPEVFWKKRSFSKFCHQNGLVPEPWACNFIKKETLVQVFSWEFCKISKNTFFRDYLWTNASVA